MITTITLFNVIFVSLLHIVVTVTLIASLLAILENIMSKAPDILTAVLLVVVWIVPLAFADFYLPVRYCIYGGLSFFEYADKIMKPCINPVDKKCTDTDLSQCC